MNNPRRIEDLIQEKINLISERCKFAEEICKSSILKSVKGNVNDPLFKEPIKYEKVKR